MKRFSLGKIGIVVMFFAVCVLPVVTADHSSNAVSATENRYLANFPQIFKEDGSLNENLRSGFEEWFNDHLGGREQLVRLSAGVKVHLLHKSSSPKVHTGRDGWYYYTQDENLQIASGEYTLTPEMLEQTLNNHLRIRDKLKSRGMEYVIVLPTSKVSIYPENMYFGDQQVRETPVDIVADYLEAHSDLKVVRLKEALLSARESHQVFFKTDTHWTQAGAYTAYREIISRLKGWGMCEAEPVDVSFEESEYIGEIGGMLGTFLPAEPTERLILQQRNAVLNPDCERYTRLSQATAAAGIHNPCYYYENPAVTGPSVIMFGDSLFGGSMNGGVMFGGWSATELLAESFPEFTYIWDTNLNEEFLNIAAPDIVIYELSERFLNTFPNKNEVFMQTGLEGPQAVVPAYEWDGERLLAAVRNTGGEAWRSVDLIRLGVFSDGQDSGLRAMLPADREVQPGEEFTFEISFADHPELLSTRLEVQMLQEGICYFGEKRPVTGLENAPVSQLDAEIISHTAPSVVSHTEGYTFEIIVKNTGTGVWSAADQIRLCIWQDDTDFGYRIELPENVVVRPGEEHVFVMGRFECPTAEQTTLGFQMLQEGICYFGECEKVTITAQ